WYLMLRLKQVTLGSLVLFCKDNVHAFSKISDSSFEEFPKVIKEIETNLKKAFNYDKINYQMLMMVDPEVHFHIFPRYSEDKNFEGFVFKDFGWPDVPSLKELNNVDDDVFDKLLKKLRETFNQDQ
ncbi:MAG: HIT family protein, partial [Patescibacteria group bacterium]